MIFKEDILRFYWNENNFASEKLDAFVSSQIFSSWKDFEEKVLLLILFTQKNTVNIQKPDTLKPETAETRTQFCPAQD